MRDRPDSFRDISALYNERRKTRDSDIAQYNEVEAAIHGVLPVDYQRLFSDSDVKLQIRTTRAADDGLTKFLSEIPILPRVQPRGKRDSGAARDSAEKVEKIAYGWLNGSALRGGTEIDGLTFQLARHQVRFGDGCIVVNPDFNRKLVYLEAKDPRCHYPPTGWTPWSQSALDETLLVYELSLGEVKRRFAYDSYGMTKSDVMMRLENSYPRANGFGDTAAANDARKIKVGVYRSREAWFVVAMSEHDVVLAESQTGDLFHPGVCGVASFRQFEADPLFLGQIGIEAGLMKVINQQIQNTERINQAPIVGPPLLGDELVWGGYNVVAPDTGQGRQITPQRMAPDSPGNLTQVMGSLLGLAQMFNYNPESNQGQGDANSGKAIQTLQAGPRSLVTNILFSPYKVAFPRVFDDCGEMELNLWPNDRKTATGTRERQSFEIDYTPSAALEGFKGSIKIEEARVGGYNAFLEAVQKKDAGMISLRRVMEMDPDIPDVEAEIRSMESESVEAFVQAAFEALGGTDPLTAIKTIAEVKRHMDDGKSKFQAIQEVINSGMLEPPAPETPAAPGELPPELAAMSGLGGPPPSLAAARGF